MKPGGKCGAMEGRQGQICRKEDEVSAVDMTCDVASLAGNMSQRGCVYCGARVVLNPITDVLHLVHGPIGCAAYTWDIRGSLTHGPDLYRSSFSTDMQEKDVIFGGEEKLYRALKDLIAKYNPPGVFAYATCIVGIIGDDLEAVCKRVTQETGVTVTPVQSEGFKGNKSAGYRAACDALLKVIGTKAIAAPAKPTINILGEFNLAGELWIIQRYFKEIGIKVNCTLTGDATYEQIRGAQGAHLNVVQCAGSMTYLAVELEKKYGMPWFKVNFFGEEDITTALLRIAEFFGDAQILHRTQSLISRELSKIQDELAFYRSKLKGKKAAVYMGGAFKTLSLIKAFEALGMEVVLAGSQTGNRQEYRDIQEAMPTGGVVIDDAGVMELAALIKDNRPDLLVGGVKERPLAYKAGIGFCDFNHERENAFAGYQGLISFAEEVYTTTCSPIWEFLREGGEDYDQE